MLLKMERIGVQLRGSETRLRVVQGLGLGLRGLVLLTSD